MEKEKMVKTAKALDTLFKILQRIIIICAAVGVVILGVITVMEGVDSSTVIGTDLNIVDIGGLTFGLTEAVAPDSTILVYAWIMMAAAVVFVAVLFYAIGVIRKILAPMTQGDPFHPTVGREIRRLAFASLAIGIIQNAMSAVEVFSVLHIFDMNALLQGSKIQSVTSNFNFELSFIVVFFVLLLMSYIFQYGEGLQKLSDETL